MALIIRVEAVVHPERRTDALAVRQHGGHVRETHAALHVAVGVGRKMELAFAVDPAPRCTASSGGSLPVSIHSTRLRSVALYTGRKLTGFWRFAPVNSRPLMSGGIWATPASSYCRKLGESCRIR